MTLHTLDQISQLGLKLLISLGLSFVMFLAGREIIRIWRESAVVLAPFEYLKDVVVVPESGETFAQLADDGTPGSWLPTADLSSSRRVWASRPAWTG